MFLHCVTSEHQSNEDSNSERLATLRVKICVCTHFVAGYRFCFTISQQLNGPWTNFLQFCNGTLHCGIFNFFFFFFFFLYFFLTFYNSIVSMRFLPWEIWVAFSGESQLRQSRGAEPTVHAGYFSVSIIHRTLTWTTGFLTCAQM